MFLIKFEQVLGLVQDTANQKGGSLYFRHGIKEAFKHLREVLPNISICIYTNTSRQLFKHCIWPGLYNILLKENSESDFLVDQIYFIAPNQEKKDLDFCQHLPLNTTEVLWLHPVGLSHNKIHNVLQTQDFNESKKILCGPDVLENLSLPFNEDKKVD